MIILVEEPGGRIQWQNAVPGPIAELDGRTLLAGLSDNLAAESSGRTNPVAKSSGRTNPVAESSGRTQFQDPGPTA